jgi:hypothetical protein
MSTKEFFSEIKQHLNPNGIIMININMRSKNSNEIVDYLTQTLKNDMKKVYKFNVPNSTNTIVYSSDDEKSLDSYLENTDRLNSDNPLRPVAKAISENLVEVTDNRYVFTDDLAPVEILGQKVLNDIVAESLVNFKQELGSSQNGIQDLFKLISG